MSGLDFPDLKLHARSKDKGRLFRTGAKPIRCKVDIFTFESDQRAAPDVGVTTCLARSFAPLTITGLALIIVAHQPFPRSFDVVVRQFMAAFEESNRDIRSRGAQ